MKTIKGILVLILSVYVVACSTDSQDVLNTSESKSKRSRVEVSYKNSDNPYDEVGAFHNEAMQLMLNNYRGGEFNYDWESNFELVQNLALESGFYNYEMINRAYAEPAFKQEYLEEGLQSDRQLTYILEAVERALNESDLNFNNARSLVAFIDAIKVLEAEVNSLEFDTEHGKTLAYMSLSIARHSAYFWNDKNNDPNSGLTGVFAKEEGDGNGSKKIAKADVKGAVAGAVSGALGGPQGAVVGGTFGGIGASWGEMIGQLFD